MGIRKTNIGISRLPEVIKIVTAEFFLPVRKTSVPVFEVSVNERIECIHTMCTCLWLNR